MSRWPFCYHLAFLAIGLGFPISSTGASDSFEKIEWQKSPVGPGFDYSWNGKPGRYYFTQTSLSLEAGSWTFFPYASKGEGLRGGIHIDLPSDKLFLRLYYTDDINDHVLSRDFDHDGFDNRIELDIGTAPFDGTDMDGNDIPDDIDQYWLNVSNSWKSTFVNDLKKNFYDSTGKIDSPSKVSPLDDYDGDGLSNLREFVDGTDPLDFFNGHPAEIKIYAGDRQTAVANSFPESKLFAKVYNSFGEEIYGAPVLFEVAAGEGWVGQSRDLSDLTKKQLVHSGSIGAYLRYRTPSLNGDYSVTASLPNGESVLFVISVVDPVQKSRSYSHSFTETLNENGTVSYTWVSSANQGDWFRIVRRQKDGSSRIIFESVYGSADLPFIHGQDEYALTINAMPLIPSDEDYE